MKLWFGAAALAAIGLTGSSAGAQAWNAGPPGGWNGPGAGNPPRATLYELPNFQGRQMVVTATAENMAAVNFNDLAQSVRLQGRWRACEDSGYRGKCKDIVGDIPDLNAVGMSLKISSLQAYAENAWSRGGGWGRPGQPGPYEGATGVLFPYPNIMGMDISPNGSGANAFCRSVQLGYSAYYDSSQRARLALDGEGRYVADSPVIRDVFCRKR